MDEAMIRERCEELVAAHKVNWHKPYELADFLVTLYRAAYADGQRDERERAAKSICLFCCEGSGCNQGGYVGDEQAVKSVKDTAEQALRETGA